jgi:hypothetical protein
LARYQLCFPELKTSLALNVLIAFFILIESLRVTAQALRKEWTAHGSSASAFLQATTFTRVI